LPVAIPVALGRRIGERLESMAPRAWHWRDRTVKLFDGTTVSMPDTPSNQQAFPQSREQKPGLGDPLRASARSSGFPVAPCSSTRLLPVKVAARVNKACCVVCLTASRQGMSCLA